MPIRVFFHSRIDLSHLRTGLSKYQETVQYPMTNEIDSMFILDNPGAFIAVKYHATFIVLQSFLSSMQASFVPFRVYFVSMVPSIIPPLLHLFFGLFFPFLFPCLFIFLSFSSFLLLFFFHPSFVSFICLSLPLFYLFLPQSFFG